ncbi:MAG TPA: hypothetical protein VJM12_16935 [Pyrinomonadaceae bacterium]|nr:hypothetical protein [Pyrinomonadaceae bacterium]
MRLKLIVLICLLGIVGCRSSDSNQNATNTQTSSPGQTSQASPASATSAAPPGTSPATAALPDNRDTASTNVKPKVDACAMLTSQDIEPIQGEALKETKLSGTSTGGFNVSQCFFTLPTFTNSVSLSVTHRGDGAGARDPREFWKETFHKEKGRDREKEREEEEEEKSEAQKVTGLGDEAFWMASRAAGALYVLKGNSYVRVSVGGSGDQQTKLKKSKALARKVIERL